MKKAFIILVSLLYITTSCKKENLQSSITGKWNWIESNGGFAGIHETPASTGKTITLTITNNQIKTYVNDSLINDSNYKLIKDKTIFGNDLKDLIVINNGLRYLVQINGNTLSLTEDGDDGINSSYKRSR